jgi:hypothetical protein
MKTGQHEIRPKRERAIIVGQCLRHPAELLEKRAAEVERLGVVGTFAQGLGKAR